MEALAGAATDTAVSKKTNANNYDPWQSGVKPKTKTEFVFCRTER
jgi:hypothetical protein